MSKFSKINSICLSLVVASFLACTEAPKNNTQTDTSGDSQSAPDKELAENTANCSDGPDSKLYEFGENFAQLIKKEKDNPMFGHELSNLSCDDAKELFKAFAVQSGNYNQLDAYEAIKNSECFCQGYYDAQK